jgi:DNA-binding CsgD family transcriptional regulator
MTDTKKFEIALINSGKTKADIAKLLGVSLQTIYNKINNIVDFKSREIIAIAKYLRLKNRDRDLIFFANKVD